MQKFFLLFYFIVYLQNIINKFKYLGHIDQYKHESVNSQNILTIYVREKFLNLRKKLKKV